MKVIKDKKKDDSIYLISNTDEFFDDCPICQAIKEGKTSLSHLKKAFQEAKKKGAIVGGRLFEEEKN